MTFMRHRRIVAVLTLVLCAALAAGLLASCAKLTAAEAHPAARNIEQVLEMRRDKVTDADRYAPFFASSGVASTLAESARKGGDDALVPEWERPYVSAEDSSSAEVVVKWVADTGPEGFAAATVFEMQRGRAGWVAVDARQVEASDDVPPPASGGQTGDTP